MKQEMSLTMSFRDDDGYVSDFVEVNATRTALEFSELIAFFRQFAVAAGYSPESVNDAFYD